MESDGHIIVAVKCKQARKLLEKSSLLRIN